MNTKLHKMWNTLINFGRYAEKVKLVKNCPEIDPYWDYIFISQSMDKATTDHIKSTKTEPEVTEDWANFALAYFAQMHVG